MSYLSQDFRCRCVYMEENQENAFVGLVPGHKTIFSKDELNLDIAIPATFGLMADPIASLVDTAFIGHLGPVEVAAVGVAIAVFNQASKIAIFPLRIRTREDMSHRLLRLC